MSPEPLRRSENFDPQASTNPFQIESTFKDFKITREISDQPSFEEAAHEIETDLSLASVLLPQNQIVDSELPSRPISECTHLPRASWHLQAYPFMRPVDVENKMLWYEGSFDPTGPHHMDVFQAAWNLGFKSAVFGICHQNPLKSGSTPFEQRVDIALLWLENKGIPIAEHYGDPGVYIEVNPKLFQYHKLVNFYDKSAYLLMGPDNFERYYEDNVPWSHIGEIRGNPQGLRDFGFRRMYNEIDGFAESILVYPRLHDYHSTDIRERNSEGIDRFVPASVKNYIDDNNLYAPTQKSAAQRKQPKGLSQGGENAVGGGAPSEGFMKSALALRRASVSGLFKDVLDRSLSLNVVAEVYPSVSETLQMFDASELVKVDRALQGQTQGSSRFTYVPRTKPLAVVSDAIVDPLLCGRTQLEGTEMLLNLLHDGKRLVFVSNFRGVFDQAFLSFALRDVGLSEIADQLVFSLGESAHSTPLESFVLQRSVATLDLELPHQPMSQSDVSDLQHQKHHKKNGNQVAKRLQRDQYPVLFPETKGGSEGFGLCSDVIASLLTHEHLRHRYLDTSDVVIVPSVSIGATSAFAAPLSVGNAAWATQDAPYQHCFGPALALKDFQDVVSSGVLDPNGYTHLLGHMIAELLPPSERGPYGVDAPNVPRSVAAQVRQAREVLDGLAGFRYDRGAARVS